MWFNLEKIKEVVFYFQRKNYNNFFVLVPTNKKLWTNTVYFKKLKFLYNRFSWKNKQLLSDYNNYFFFQEKKNKFFNTLFNKNQISFFYCFILLINSLNFLIYNKNKYTLLKNELLKQKYILLLNKKKLFFLSDYIQLKNIFLIFKLFYLYDKILLNLELYVYFVEYFFFDLKNFVFYLKTYMLKRCPLRIKVRIWDKCKFPVDGKKVFYRAEGRWIERQREIFEEHNKGFFDSIDYDTIYLLWVVNKFTLDQKTRLHRYHRVLYFKSEFINNKIKYLKYKSNHLKKKQYIINFFSFIIKQFSLNNYYNKNYIIKLIKNLSLFFNRLKLLHLIFSRKRKIKEFLTKKISFKGLYVLDFEKKKVMYIFFFIFFLTNFKPNFIIDDSLFKKLHFKFKKIQKINKSLFRVFKLLFWLSYKIEVDYYYTDIRISKKLTIFIFSFLFFFIEKKLFNNKTSFQNYINIEKHFLFKDFYLNKIDIYLFYYLWKILATNYATEIDDLLTKRYKLLNIVLFSNYKKYWLRYNLNFFKKFEKFENILIKNLRSLNFFFSNENILRKLYNHYYLFSFNFFNFSQYKNLLKNKFFLIKKLIKKKKKRKSFNKLNFLKKKYFNLFSMNKKYKKSIYISFCFFLLKKIKNLNLNIKKKIYFLKKKYTRLNLNIIIKKKGVLNLFYFLKLKNLKHLFKIYFIYLNRKKRNKNFNNLPLFFKLSFGVVKAFYFFLEKDRVQLTSLNFESIILNLMLFYFINKIKKIKNKNYMILKKNINLKLQLFLWKNNLKKKNFLYFNKNFFLNENINNKIISPYMLKNLKDIHIINKFIKKKLYLIKSLNFFLIIKDNLLNHFLFLFKESLVKDMVLNVGDNLLCWRTFFDFKVDKGLFSYGKKFKKVFVKTNLILNFSSHFFKYFTIFWLILKHKIYLETLKIFINKKLIFILWHDIFNSEEKKYIDLYLDDYSFKYTIKYYRYLFNIFKKNIIFYTPDVVFLIQLLTHHINLLINKVFEFNKLNELNLKMLMRNYNFNQSYLDTFTFYLKYFFFKLIRIKYRKKKINKINYSNNLLYLFSYSSNILLKKNNVLKLKEEYLIFNKNIIVCNKCSFLYTDKNVVNKFNYYQNLIKLNKLNNNILKFDFILCENCSSYKLCVKSQPIKYFISYNAILKYLILNSIKTSYVFFQKKIYLFSLKKKTNYIFFEEVKFINLVSSKYKLKGLYFFLFNSDRIYFNIFLKFENLEIFSFYCFFFFLVEIIYFFELNEFFLTPTLVKKLNRWDLMISFADHLQDIKAMIKWYRKKYKMKLTKKKRKEIKLGLLNKFFEDFKKG